MMKKMDPVPITNWVYGKNAPTPRTLILLDVVHTHQPNEFDIYLIFRSYVELYRFEVCIAARHNMRCKPISVGNYDSIALKLAQNGRLEITEHLRNPFRVRITFTNKSGFRASVLAPKISLMPFFCEPNYGR